MKTTSYGSCVQTSSSKCDRGSHIHLVLAAAAQTHTSSHQLFRFPQDSLCHRSVQVTCQDSGSVVNGGVQCEPYTCLPTTLEMEAATFNPSRPLLYNEKTTVTCKLGYQVAPATEKLATCGALAVGFYPAICKDCSIYNESVRCLPVACDVDLLNRTLVESRSGFLQTNVTGMIPYGQGVPVGNLFVATDYARLPQISAQMNTIFKLFHICLSACFSSLFLFLSYSPSLFCHASLLRPACCLPTCFSSFFLPLPLS
jgi:hypothetical protein